MSKLFVEDYQNGEGEQQTANYRVSLQQNIGNCDQYRTIRVKLHFHLRNTHLQISGIESQIGSIHFIILDSCSPLALLILLVVFQTAEQVHHQV